MNKTYKISFSIIAFFLIIAVGFGIITRNSYKNLDLDNAIFSVETDLLNYTEENIYALNTQDILSELESANVIFVVTVKSSENIRQCTKTTVTVDRIIKGDNELINNNIVIYEPNFIYYHKESKQQYYYLVNSLNNLMQVNKQYLVFANKVEYSDAYQATLNVMEYVVDMDLNLYSFPINNPIDYIKVDEVSTYRDVKSYDYFCYSEKQSSILNKILIDVLDEYL